MGIHPTWRANICSLIPDCLRTSGNFSPFPKSRRLHAASLRSGRRCVASLWQILSVPKGQLDSVISLCIWFPGGDQPVIVLV
jgi:hypothetical protein